MQIEVNRDIDKFKESVVLGLSLKQLIYSVLTVIVGAMVILIIYPYVGLTISAYIAVPIVSPIALSGFYSYHGMSFMEMIGLRIRFMSLKNEYIYISTEDEDEIHKARIEAITEEKNKNKMTFAERLIAKKEAKQERMI